jgi:hypothetical protein
MSIMTLLLFLEITQRVSRFQAIPGCKASGAAPRSKHQQPSQTGFQMSGTNHEQELECQETLCRLKGALSEQLWKH